jgi:hypothetical protein
MKGENMFWKRKPLLFAIVSQDEAKSIPYPYVYIEKDGTVRELHTSERKYLETPYYPTDGARPYVKRFFDQKNDVGDIRGFLTRSKTPSGILIHEPPTHDPSIGSYEEFIENEINTAEELGFEVINKGDGKVIFRKKKQD